MTTLLKYLQVIEYLTQLTPLKSESCHFTYQAALFTITSHNGGVA